MVRQTQAIRQLVVLVGGKGTRLGALAKDTPKPLMPIAEDRVFLDFLLEGAVRQGFTHILFIAGHLGDQVVDRYAYRQIGGAQVDVLVEPSAMGTGGALRFARDALADRFVLMNGDTIFDVNIRALDARLAADPALNAVMALRAVDDVGRYGAVDWDADTGLIRQIHEKDPALVGMRGFINGGIYALRKSVLALVPEGPCSLEVEVLPQLAQGGGLAGVSAQGYFLDIGLPETLAQAMRELPARQRPVLFLDRDGVLNVDKGYTGTPEAWEWMPGAIEVVRAANDLGIAVVVVTNQAGVARGYYAEAQVWQLHAHVQQLLHAQGAFVDAFYYSPDHPDALDDVYRITAPLGRKPDPGMLLRAFRQHGYDRQAALLVGDQPTDLAAAEAAGIPGLKFAGGRLDDCVFGSSQWRALTGHARL